MLVADEARVVFEAMALSEMGARMIDEPTVAKLLAIIDRLQTPAVVLEEAERLLREASVTSVYLCNEHVWACLPIQSGPVLDKRSATLAEAYAALREGT